MGVLGLWQILESVGHPIKIDGLEGKRLGVDANIWLYKFIRGFREKDSAESIDSHKLGLYNRVCKLLFYKIKPVFVFDGPAPVLKRRTLERRQNTRNKNLTKIQTTAMKLLAEHLKEQYPDIDLSEKKICLPEFRSNNLAAAEKLTDEDRKLFYLPPATKEEQLSSSDEEYEFGDQTIDVNSEDFKKLTPEMRYEILQDKKLISKKIRRAEAMPENATDFSNLQLQRLKARRAIQEKIEECEREICGTYTGEMTYRIQSDPTKFMVYTKQQKESPKQEPLEQKPMPKPNPETKPADTVATKTVISEYISKPMPQLASKLSQHSSIVRAKTMESESGKPQTTGAVVKKIMDLSESDSDQDQPQGSAKVSENSTRAPEPALRQTQETVSVDPDMMYVSESDSEPALLPQQGTSKSDHHTSGEIASELEPVRAPLQSTSNTTLGAAGEIGSESEPEPQPERQQVINTSLINKTVELSSDSDSDLEPVVEKPIGTSTDPKNKTVVLDTDSETEIDSQQTQPLETHKTARKIFEISDSDTDTELQISKERTQDSPKIAARKQIDPEPWSGTAPESRETNRVTTKIVEEAKELLRLFGIPYIDAAGEAEAQCALLESLKLTEGTITDDSDIWLFGAKNVYRYFFSDDKWVMQYKMSDIEFHLRMTRENLVCFAMLVGSDYTDGIMNVGPVTALEILSEFRGDDITPLVKYKEFVDEYKTQNKKILKGTDLKKRRRLLKYEIPNEFPSQTVYDGYMRPVADTSDEEFSWGLPDEGELREYARRNFGWSSQKIDEKLLPVMKKLSEKKTQPTIDSYFFKTAANQNPELFRSKRVNAALKKISNTDSTTADDTAAASDDKKEKTRKPPPRRKPNATKAQGKPKTTKRGSRQQPERAKKSNQPVPEVVCLSETDED